MADDEQARQEAMERANKARSMEEALEAAKADTEEKKPKKKKFNRRFPTSKRHKNNLKARGDRKERRAIPDAIKAVKAGKAAKFDESMELHLKLGVDGKKADQQVRGTFAFPHGVGQSKRVIAFAEGPMADAAREAGAIEVGGDDLKAKIEGGWFDFDVVVAHPAMMRVVGQLGRVLGPKKLMPNPKEGSVTPHVGKAVAEFKGGKSKYRLDDTGNLHIVFGKRSFDDQKLSENLEAFVKHLQANKPTGAKGTFIEAGSIASTMGVGVAIDLGFLNT